MPTSGISLANDLYYRLDQRVTPNQTIYFLNQGLAKIDSTASWVWDLVTVIGAVPVANVMTLPAMNQGKKVSCFNSVNKLPISRVDQTDMASSASGYLNVGTTIYSTFSLSTNATFQPTLTFYPPLPGFPTVDIYYNQVAPTLVINNALVTVRWLSPEMDNLLLDIGESNARWYYKMPHPSPGFDEDIDKRLMMLSATFSTERIATGPPQEVSGGTQEREQLGRG